MNQLSEMPLGTIIWRDCGFSGYNLTPRLSEDNPEERRISLGGTFMFEPVIIPGVRRGLVAFTKETLRPDWCCVELTGYSKNKNACFFKQGPDVPNYLEFRMEMALAYQGAMNSPNEAQFIAASKQLFGLKRLFTHRKWMQESERPGYLITFVKFDGWE